MRVSVAVVVLVAACHAGPTYPGVEDPAPSPDALLDAPGSSCDPLAQTGCDVGAKCTWTRTIATPADLHGLIECVPDGTVALGGACTWGASGTTTGYDNCLDGLACLAPADQEMATGTCEAICDVLAAAGAPGSCGGGFTCMRHDGYFANASNPMTEAGLCNPS